MMNKNDSIQGVAVIFLSSMSFDTRGQYLAFTCTQAFQLNPTICGLAIVTLTLIVNTFTLNHKTKNKITLNSWMDTPPPPMCSSV